MMMNVIVLLMALQISGVGQEAAPPQEGLSMNPVFQLKPGKGRELVQANCIPCHSTAIVAANHMSREGWSKTIDTMQKKNGMWPLAPEIRSRLLDYLGTAQRVEDRGLEQGKSSPWATPLYRPNPLWK